MLDYCVRDVQVNALVLKKLREESKGFAKQSINLEQDVARIMKQQELNGFKFNEMKAQLLLAEHHYLSRFTITLSIYCKVLPSIISIVTSCIISILFSVFFTENITKYISSSVFQHSQIRVVVFVE